MKKPTARDLRLLILYGITEAEYAEILAGQGGECPICLKPPKRVRLSVEHRHSDGLLRGICCWQCNKAIAYLRDNLGRAERLSDYLTSPPAILAIDRRYGRPGRSTRKWRTKRERRERMDFVASRLAELGYQVPRSVSRWIR